MVRNIALLASLIFVTIISCNLLKDYSLKSITERYNGEMTIAKGVRASTSAGKIKYLKLTVENNSFVASGWLSPDAMANNCAMLLVKENPQLFDETDQLEIEIINTVSSLFEYQKEDIFENDIGYNKIESILTDFINLLEANKIDEAMHFMKSGSNTNMHDMASFLKTVKGVLPARHKGTKLIGFLKGNQSGKTYEIDFVVISQDKVQRMLKATLMEDQNGLKFSSITI